MDAIVNPRLHEPVVLPYDEKDRETWVKTRQETIGAAESSALFSSVVEEFGEAEDEEGAEYTDEDGEPASPYLTPLALYALKTGAIRRDMKFSFGDRAFWGMKNQPIIAKAFADEHGWALRKPPGLYIHPIVKRMSAYVNYEIDMTAGLGEWIPFEIRSVSNDQRWKWRNSIGQWIVPAHIEIQLQHLMSVTGTRKAVIGVLFGGCEPRHFTVERDDAMVADIEAAVSDFAKCLDAGREPQADYARDASILAQIRLKIEPGKVLDWTRDEAMQALYDQVKFHAAQETFHKNEKSRLRTEMLDKMGDANAARLSDDKMLNSFVVEGGPVSYIRASARQVRLVKPPKKHTGRKSASTKN